LNVGKYDRGAINEIARRPVPPLYFSNLFFWDEIVIAAVFGICPIKVLPNIL
jgi:hypothetical protein